MGLPLPGYSTRERSEPTDLGVERPTSLKDLLNKPAKAVFTPSRRAESRQENDTAPSLASARRDWLAAPRSACRGGFQARPRRTPILPSACFCYLRRSLGCHVYRGIVFARSDAAAQRSELNRFAQEIWGHPTRTHLPLGIFRCAAASLRALWLSIIRRSPTVEPRTTMINRCRPTACVRCLPPCPRHLAQRRGPAPQTTQHVGEPPPLNSVPGAGPRGK